MKPTTGSLAVSILLATAMPLPAPVAHFPIPERFGLVDIIPTSQSGETNQNSEPSLGVAVGTNYGELVVHAFTPPSFDNYYYTTGSGGPPWTNSGQVLDGDATLDWSTAGTCYMASLYQGSLKVRKSSNPASVPFTTIAAATYSAPPNGSYPDQPTVRVVNVTNTDHIFVGFNDLTKSVYYKGSGKTASVRYSLDGGSSWRTTVLEKTTPGGEQDSPAVRLAISADGTRVYALFQRETSWTGTTFGSDYVGDVVVMRDDEYGGSGYGALGSGNGTLVAHNIVIPYVGGTTLGAERLGSSCDVAINPTQHKQVYVAYTEIVSGTPVLRVQSSTNSGAAFSLVYSITNASLPALAVTTDGIVGLLYAAQSGKNLVVQFLKAFTGSFASGSVTNRTLARWSNNNPIRAGDPYIGDYFTLKAVGYDFYGAFSASGEPQPTHFPSGVFYQRNVKVSGTVTNNFTLSSSGTLVDLSDNPVAPSIDPFAFYDIAPGSGYLPVVEIVLPFFYNPVDPYFDPGDPYSGVTHVLWPVLPENQPQFQLVSSLSLASVANWAVVPANSIAQANGAFGAIVDETQPQQFYRLRRDLTGAQFNLFVSADGNGALNMSGVVATAAGGNQTITATPANNYAVGNWHLDGAVIPANGPSLTLSNITDEHTVLANFVASNDLAVTVAEFPEVDGPTVTFSANSYVINIVNQGLNLLTGISMSNTLPATVSFVSAVSTQGSVNHSGGVVTASLGSLSAGDSATVTINFQTSTAGSITDTVSVACSQSEPNLANNTATDVTFVYDPVIITNQPASQTVQAGGNAFFSVGVSGTPPFSYQWFFNGVLIDNATNPTLTLTGVSADQAGSYSVSVYQMPAPEDVIGADSDPAILTIPVWSPVPPTLISPGAVTADGAPTLTNLTPTFYWSASNQAASSDLIITKSPYGSGNIVITVGVGTNSSYQIPSGILQPETAYSWYMYSFNSVGDESAASSSLYFWTPSAPIVTTLSATNIFSNRATLQGFVNPGGAAATAYFEYGTTTNYGSLTTPTGIGALPQNFTANITGLASGTLYHCRIDATNSAGTGMGLDKTFNTP